MNDIQTLLSGIALGCAIARYFIGLGYKIGISAQEGEVIGKKQKPTEQESTE